MIERSASGRRLQRRGCRLGLVFGPLVHGLGRGRLLCMRQCARQPTTNAHTNAHTNTPDNARLEPASAQWNQPGSPSCCPQAGQCTDQVDAQAQVGARVATAQALPGLWPGGVDVVQVAVAATWVES